MAARNCFESLGQELVDNIFARVLATGAAVASETTPLAVIRLTCKEWALVGLQYIRKLRVRDGTEVRHVRRFLEHANHKKLEDLDARLSKSNKGLRALVEELGRHAWKRMHLEGAARNAKVWEASTGTLKRLSTNNRGRAFRASAQEEAWEVAGETGDYSYFKSIAGFPMLHASLVNCKSLCEVELTLDPLNLNWHLRFAPRKPWRLIAVNVLTVEVGRPEHDGEGSFKSILAREPHSGYMKGFDLLSAAFPQVAHVKFPAWRFPLGNDIEVSPSLAGYAGWQGVRVLEMGTAGLPYTRGARVSVGNIVKRIQVFNWPDVEKLVVWGTHCHHDSWPFDPFLEVYTTFVEPDRAFLKKLRELIIEHPVARLSSLGSEHAPEYGVPTMFRNREEMDGEMWRDFQDLPEVWNSTERWVGQRKDLPNRKTSLLTLSKAS